MNSQRNVGFATREFDPLVIISRATEVDASYCFENSSEINIFMKLFLSQLIQIRFCREQSVVSNILFYIFDSLFHIELLFYWLHDNYKDILYNAKNHLYFRFHDIVIFLFISIFFTAS